MANDNKTQDVIQNAMLVYRGSLETARDVFGKGNMSDEVMCTAIREAGSMVYQVLNALNEPTDLTLLEGDGE